MPTYSVNTPSGQAIDVDAPNQDLANQFVFQRFLSGLEQPSNAASNSPQSPFAGAPMQSQTASAPNASSSGIRPYQNPLAQWIAAKRSGDANAVPTVADI